MENETARSSKAKRYTEEEKAQVIDFINSYAGRGAQKAAAQQFGVSAVTISNWLKAAKTQQKPKRGRRPGSKNDPVKSVKNKLLASNPEDLRKLASLMEEIAELESLVEKLTTLRAEADELRSKLLS